MRFERLATLTGASLALLLVTSSIARQISSQPTGTAPAQADASERFDSPGGAPTTAPAAQQPALPPGHPPLPGSAGAQSAPQLPVGHPPLPSGVGPVDPNKVAGKSLPAGHPQVNQNMPPTTNPAGTGIKMPPLPPDSATLDIRIVQGTAGAAAITSGTPMLELYDGEKLFASMPTPLEADGHIHIYDIPIQKPYLPVVKMNYAGVEYEVVGEPIDAQHAAQDIALTVYEPTTTPPEWLIRMRHVMLQPTASHIEVSDVFVIENPGDHVFTRNKDSQGKAEVVFTLSLPPGAHDVHVMSGFGASQMTIEDGKLVNRVGMLPGQSQYQIAYALPVNNGSLNLVLASPVAQKNVAVLLPDDGTTVETTGLNATGTSDMGSGTKVRLYKASDLPAGSEIKMSISGFGQIETSAPAAGEDPAAHLKESPATQPAAAAAKPSAQRFAIVGLVGVVVAGLAFALAKRAPKQDADAGSVAPSKATR